MTEREGGSICGPRTLEELKAETQRRADRNLGPLAGVTPEDARAALARIHTLDRDAWAQAWIDVGQRFAASHSRITRSTLGADAAR